MRHAVLVIALLILSACSSNYSPYGGSKQPQGVKLGKPYEVMGQYYEPKYDPNYSEEGIASWYGPGFHGRMTASGEEFDTAEMTCAHRTLPMPSLLRVENLDNGRTAVVRVNDRGPFAKNRIIDLSSAAAEKLGVKATGTARVKVSYLREETNRYIADLGLGVPPWMQNESIPPRNLDQQYASLQAKDSPKMTLEEDRVKAPEISIKTTDLAPPPSSVRPPSADFSVSKTSNSQAMQAPTIQASYQPIEEEMKHGYAIQTASFSNRDNAESHLMKLASVGQAFIKEIIVNGQTFFRVSVGPVKTSQQAQQLLEQARQLGFTDARILVN